MNRTLAMKQSHRLIVGPTSSGANALTGLGWLAPRYDQHSRTVGIGQLGLGDNGDLAKLCRLADQTDSRKRDQIGTTANF